MNSLVGSLPAYNVAMADRVKVWLGRADSKETFEQFYQEGMSTDGPVSAFAASQNESFIDSDFIEFYFDEKGESLSDLFTGASYGESFVDQVLAAAPKDSFNCGILEYRDEISSPTSFEGQGIDLRFLGEFDYDQKARPHNVAGRYGYALLEILSGGPLPFNGSPVMSVKVDAFGLMIGRGQNPYMPQLDISSLAPEASETQARISVDKEKLWEVRDFGQNGLTKKEGTDFSGQNVKSDRPVRFSIGLIEFLLTPQQNE